MHKTLSASLRLLACGVLLCAASAGHAQWKWIDAKGNTVYSDRPPPASVPKNKILQQGTNTQQYMGSSAPAAAPQKDAEGTQPELTPEQKKMQEKAETQAKAEAQRQAQQRQESCKRALQSKATLNSGMRLSTTDADGNRAVMDDAARASELKRINEIIASDCGK